MFLVVDCCFLPELSRFCGFGGYFFNDFVKTSIVHSVGNECFASCVLLHKVVKIWGGRAGVVWLWRASRAEIKYKAVRARNFCALDNEIF